jgi:protein disulfide-isomerase
MGTLISIALLAAATSGFAALMPYDETADAKEEIRIALAEAQRAGVPVLVVFGANWCTVCQSLDMKFKSGMSATLIKNSFKVVKIDVGRMNRNVDIAETYGVPVGNGIPAAAVLSQQGKVVHVASPGELSGGFKWVLWASMKSFLIW